MLKFMECYASMFLTPGPRGTIFYNIINVLLLAKKFVILAACMHARADVEPLLGPGGPYGDTILEI